MTPYPIKPVTYNPFGIEAIISSGVCRPGSRTKFVGLRVLSACYPEKSLAPHILCCSTHAQEASRNEYQIAAGRLRGAAHTYRHTRIRTKDATDKYVLSQKTVQWNPKRTAIIVIIATPVITWLLGAPVWVVVCQIVVLSAAAIFILTRPSPAENPP